MSAFVSDVKVTKKDYADVPAEYKKWLPTVCLGETYECTLNNVNVSLANGIRRVLASEYLVKGLVAEYEDVTVTDEFVIMELLLKRISMIPIKQSIAPDVTFSLEYENNTNEIQPVWSGLMLASDKEQYFNETFNLCDLRPGCRLSIKKVSVESHMGHENGYGMFAVALNPVAIVQDVVPYLAPSLRDEEAKNSKKVNYTASSVSDPTVYLLRFNTHGTADGKDIFRNAVQEILHRLQNVDPSAIIETDTEFKLEIMNETDTIGNILMYHIAKAFPNIDMVTYNTLGGVRRVTLRILAQSRSDAEGMVREAVKNASASLTSLAL